MTSGVNVIRGQGPWQLVLLGPKFRGQTGLGGESLFWNGLETGAGACWGVGTGNRGWQGHTQDAALALTGQDSHPGVLMGGLPVLLPMAGVGPGALPKLPFSTGRDYRHKAWVTINTPNALD